MVHFIFVKSLVLFLLCGLYSKSWMTCIQKKKSINLHIKYQNLYFSTRRLKLMALNYYRNFMRTWMDRFENQQSKNYVSRMRTILVCMRKQRNWSIAIDPWKSMSFEYPIMNRCFELFDVIHEIIQDYQVIKRVTKEVFVSWVVWWSR